MKDEIIGVILLIALYGFIAFAIYDYVSNRKDNKKAMSEKIISMYKDIPEVNEIINIKANAAKNF